MMPVNDKIAALVTAMHSANIQSTMCDGKWLMRDRKILTLDEEAILKEACERAKAIYKRAGIVLPDRFPVVKVQCCTVRSETSNLRNHKNGGCMMNKELLAVAKGTKPADLVIQNGKIVNVYSGEIYEGGVAVCGDKIAAVGDVAYCIGEGTKVIDAGAII